MNAEIYFPRNGRSFDQTTSKRFDSTIKKLSDINLNIIYKTEIDLTENSISEALSVSESGDEKIGIIFIADAITEDSEEKAREIFDNFGMIDNIKRYEIKCKDLEGDPSADDEDKNKKKKKKKKGTDENEETAGTVTKSETKSKDVDINDIGLIDISGGVVTIEQEKLYFYTAEYNGKTIVLLPPGDAFDVDFSTVIFTSARKIISPKKKRSFWKRFFPCKGDRPVDVVRKVILMLAICTFFVSSYMLLNIMVIEPAVNDHTTNEIKGLLVSEADTPDKPKSKPKDGSDGVLPDFEKLLATNPDTVGWVTVPNTVIDYVAVQPQEPKDSEYYLHRDFYGNYSKYGTIFMDYRSKLDSKNMILHGHHMQDGRMFANLNYFDDLEFYKKTPVFTFNTLYEKNKWKIISVFKTNTLEWQGEFFNYLRGSFTGDYDFLNFVYELRARSIIDCPVSLNENDTIVTLSTCNYDMEDFRLVVVARKVRDGEDETVDVSKAKFNPEPLYPDAWYYTYGGSKPTITSFQDAFNNKKIDWYDGNGKWTSKDDEELQRLLIEGKQNAGRMMKEYLKGRNYLPEQQAEIDEIIEKYKKQIEEASKASMVNDLYAQAIAELDRIRTKEQVKEDEEASRKRYELQQSEIKIRELSDAKMNAINKMKNTVSDKLYRQDERVQVEQIVADYTVRITDVETAEEAERLADEAIEQLVKIKTSAELQESDDEIERGRLAEESKKAEASRQAEASKRAEESRLAEQSRQAEQSRLAEESREASRRAAEALEEHRNNAIRSLETYVESIVTYYTPEQQGRMRSVVSTYSREIKNSKTSQEIDDNLNKGKALIDKITDEVKPSSSTPTTSSSVPSPEPVSQPEQSSEPVSETTEVSE